MHTVILRYAFPEKKNVNLGESEYSLQFCSAEFTQLTGTCVCRWNMSMTMTENLNFIWNIGKYFYHGGCQTTVEIFKSC